MSIRAPFVTATRSPAWSCGVNNAAQIASLSEDKRGNKAMALVGSGIRSCIRAVDHLFRIRRDEFCVLLPETDVEGAHYVLRRLERQSRTGDLWENALELAPEVSIALSSAPNPDIKSGEDLLMAARKGLH